MFEKFIKEGFGPLVAVITSDGAEKTVAGNNLSFADLLLPFNIVKCDIKDPNGHSFSSQVHFDFRNIRGDGFLLSLTVLPSVLHEAITEVASTGAADTSVAANVFCETLLRWAEPAEYEFLRAYLACIFVVSAGDVDPLDEMTKIIQVQHVQQHGGSATTFGPPHCVPPKWLLPNIYKFYVLIHDNSTGDMSRTDDLYSSLCSLYGIENCHLLRINSGNVDAESDIWNETLIKKYRGLYKGLHLARKNVLSKAGASSDSCQSTELDENSDTSYQTYNTNLVHGQMLNDDDRDSIKNFIDSMSKTGLIPFFERQICILNEQIAARRGISKSFASGMRKWFGAVPQSTLNADTSYSSESTEMQSRRLADLCFIFGLYGFAYQIYQSIKKEFAVDQAWLHHAGALEMAAFSCFLNSPISAAKNYPSHYMDGAIGYYSTTCGRPLATVRAALLSASLLIYLELYVHAATQLLKLSVLESDLYCGILIERASFCFEKAGMVRKKAFHLVLAGHRLRKANQKTLSLECYKRALSEYLDKNWRFAEDQIICTLISEDEGEDGETCTLCERLIRIESPLTAEQLNHYLKCYLLQLSRYAVSSALPPTAKIPLVNFQNILVIYGCLPSKLSADLEKTSGDSIWSEFERSAFSVASEKSDVFTSLAPFSCAYTCNSKIFITPPFEKYRLFLNLRNPLEVPLTLKRVFLDIIGAVDHFQQSIIDEVYLRPQSDWTTVELSVIPDDKMCEFNVKGVIFDLCFDNLSVTCRIPLVAYGHRSNSSKQQQSANDSCRIDRRLLAHVSSDRWPLLRIELPYSSCLNLICGQFFFLDCVITNIGKIPVQSLVLCVNRPDYLVVFEEVCNSEAAVSWKLVQFEISPSNKDIVIFKLNQSVFALNEFQRLKIAVHAPSENVCDFRLSFLFYYRGVNAMFRNERHCIVISAKKILHTSLGRIESADESYMLTLKNETSGESELTKLEFIRLRSLSGYVFTSIRPNCFSVSAQSIRLESNQCRNLCFRALHDQSFASVYDRSFNRASGVECLWFSNSISGFPEWPVSSHLFISNGLNISIVRQNSQSKLLVGLLWKATIVNTDGLVSNILGENFISAIRDSDSASVTPAAIINDARLNGERERIQLEDISSILCVVKTKSDIILHDFATTRMCGIPVEVVLTNGDISRRNCCIVLQYVEPYESVRAPRISSNEIYRSLSTAQVHPPIHAWSPSSQPIVVANRTSMRAKIAYGSTHVFQIILSVPCASVYTISCFQAEAKFDGCDKVVPIFVPSAYVTVVTSGCDVKNF